MDQKPEESDSGVETVLAGVIVNIGKMKLDWE